MNKSMAHIKSEYEWTLRVSESTTGRDRVDMRRRADLLAREYNQHKRFWQRKLPRVHHIAS